MRDKKKLLISTIVSILIFIGLAVLVHELYEMLPSILTSVLFPVNESPWEHCKLFYIPALALFIIEYLIIGKKFRNYFFARVVSLLVMPVSMLAIYYGYIGLGVKNTVFLSIILTIVTIIIGLLTAYYITISKRDYSKFNIIALVLLICIILAYAIFTYYPPNCRVFYDHLNCCYGIIK